MFDRRNAISLGLIGTAGLVLPGGHASARPEKRPGPAARPPVRHRTVDVNGIRLFYREAGDPRRPTLLLLHGFPSSSHMFRNLLPALADAYRLIAPDYPAFGFSDFPLPGRFAYSFAGYADLLAGFVDALGLKSYGIYIQDYGSPIGLRLALQRPGAIRFMIVQNGNAYEEGLSAGWAPLKAYWRDRTAENRRKLMAWLGPDGVRLQYTAGLTKEQLELMSPELWALDWALLSRPGNIDVQLDLFGDYGSNVALYRDFQAYFRKHRPPTLIAWGRNDPFFTVDGARAYLRDLPRAELHLLDGSHFLLETHGPEVFALMRDFARRID